MYRICAPIEETGMDLHELLLSIHYGMRQTVPVDPMSWHDLLDQKELDSFLEFNAESVDYCMAVYLPRSRKEALELTEVKKVCIFSDTTPLQITKMVIAAYKNMDGRKYTVQETPEEQHHTRLQSALVAVMLSFDYSHCGERFSVRAIPTLVSYEHTSSGYFKMFE